MARQTPTISVAVCLASWILSVSAAACVRKERLPEGMVLISSGEFIMGSNEEDTEGKAVQFGTVKPWFLDEHPQRKVFVDAFSMDMYEVTNARYKNFAVSTDSRFPPHWEKAPTGGVVYPVGHENYPVTNVNWYDAERFCRWEGKRLPLEAEWEKAARGTDGRVYPWGQEFDPARANTGDTKMGGLASVGSFEGGKSVYGVYDLAGNAWEWTDDWYKPYPGSTYRSEAYGEKHKVLRGGSWGGTGHYALAHFYRAAYRFYAEPEKGYADVGFRCARDLH